MDIKLYKYNTAKTALEVIGLCDDFLSCVFQRSFTGIGEWTVVLSNNSHNINAFKQAEFIQIRNKLNGFIIQSETVIDEEDQTTTFTGIELKGLAYLRVIDPSIVQNGVLHGSVGSIKATLLGNNLAGPEKRKIPTCQIQNKNESTWASNVSVRPVYDNLAEVIMRLSYTYDSGWDAYINGTNIVFSVDVAGSDRTESQNAAHTKAKAAPFIITQNRETMLTRTVDKIKHLPNVAYVAGQGAGKDRTIAIVNENDVSGIDRYEMLVDARDLSEESELPARGLQYLAQYGSNVAYTCVVNPNLYKYELNNGDNITFPFDVGDVATIKDDELSENFDVRIETITEIYEEGALKVEIGFGQNVSNLQDNLSLLSSRTDSLLRCEPSFYTTNDNEYNFLRYWLGVRDGLYPKIKLWASLQDDPTATSGEQSIEGNYYGAISLQAWNERNNSTNRRALYIYDSTNTPSLASSLVLSDWINNARTDYKVFHEGNAANLITNTTLGDINIGTGNITISTKGNISTKDGGIWTNNGSISTSNGSFVSDKGNVFLKDGSINITKGNINTSNGSFGSDKGSLYLKDGSINITKGNITLDSGDITISGQYYPTIKINPTNNNTAYNFHIEGSYAGDIGIQAWADAAGNNRTVLSVYNPTAKSSINERAQLRCCSNGTWTTYNMLHTGNIASYATPLSPSSVSSAISWVSTYIDTASGKASYAMYKLGKIRILRVKVVLKSALTATTTIGTITSGNRPIMEMWGDVRTLSGSTIDVRALTIQSGGNIQMYSGAKATTYYGSIVYTTS